MDELGDGRYRVGRRIDRRLAGSLFRAVDTRLGRTVLVQCDDDVAFPPATALHESEHPHRAPLLDGGEEPGPGGTRRSYTVYPDSLWTPVADLNRWQRRRVRATVALDTDELLVDPAWLEGSVSDDDPVLWLPSPGALARLEPSSRRWTPVGSFPAPFREEVA